MDATLNQTLPPHSSRISFVLVRPSHPGNIGAAARAIKTMGFTDLRVVAPVDHEYRTNPDAVAFSTSSVDVLKHSRDYPSLEAALTDVALVIEAKVSATGQLYGSVNTNIVAAELAKKGIEVDRKIITMRDIKNVGTYEATIHFHKEVEVKVPVTVVAENQAVVETPAAEEVSEAVETPAENTAAPTIEEEEAAYLEEKEEAAAAE